MKKYYWNSFGVKTERGWEFPDQAPDMSYVYKDSNGAMDQRTERLKVLYPFKAASHHFDLAIHVRDEAAVIREGGAILPPPGKLNNILVFFEERDNNTPVRVVGYSCEMITETNI